MASPPPRTSTSRSNRDDVMQLLDSLDTYTPAAPSSRGSAGSAHSAAASSGAGAPPPLPRSSSNSTLRSSSGATGARHGPAGAGATGAASGTGANAASKPPPSAAEAQSVLDFLDEITQRSSPASSTAGGAGAGASGRTTGTLGRSTSRQSLTSSTGPTPSAPSGPSAPRRSVDAARTTPTVQRTQVRTPASAPNSAAAATRAAPSPRAAGPLTTSAAPDTSPEAAAGSAAAGSASADQPDAAPSAPAGPAAAAGGWGWSSMWSSASTVVQQASTLAQQARTAAEEQVKTATSQGAGGIAGIGGGLMKALGENEQAKKWSEGVISYAKGAHLDQLGKELKSTTLKSLTDLLNAVAPPIAEHEVIEVSLSHDMVGYDGVEALVYRGFSKIMDQIEGGTLVVNPANEDKQSESKEGDDETRDLNVIDGLSEGWKLAESKLEHLIKTTYKVPEAPAGQEAGMTVPVTNCPVYMRLQPVLAPLPSLPSSCLPTSTPDPTALKSLFFLVLLRDPTHHLVHSSLSQSMPASWLEIPFEENEWVEDAMVEIIRRSVEIIGQEYISHRMRAQTVAIEQARAEAQKTLEQHQTSPSEVDPSRASSANEPVFDAQTEADASQAAQEARVGVV